MKYLQGHLVIPKIYKGYNSYNKIRTHITPYDGPFFFKEHQRKTNVTSVPLNEWHRKTAINKNKSRFTI